ncbi:MAG: N-acyl-D-amino-acid deacylase family protein [Acidimicrobiales bacterium]
MAAPRPLVIKNGLVVDGTGAEPREADVAMRDGVITEVGAGLDTAGADTFDAQGLLVTPGFVDIHTHFDGQATWDPILAPSSDHGVTSVAMGNCGVGFAPVIDTDEQHDWLIGMLEGVEDIPGTALAEGLPWDWESFGDYLDALDRRSYTLDIGTHVVHAPLRAYVMGERGADPHELPTAEELATMADAVRAGMAAGALGFTTSRTVAHRTRDGDPLGTRFSSADELAALIGAMADTGAGVVQLISDAYLSTDPEFVAEELNLMRSLVEHSGRPMSMTTQQVVDVPDRWREMVAWVGDGVDAGLPMRNQVAPRPVGVLEGLTASVNPLVICPSFREIADRPLAEKVAALRDPERRARIVAEHPEVTARLEGLGHTIFTGFDKLFPMDEPVDYEPDPSSSVAARAARRGVSPVEEVIDLLVEDDGHQLLMLTLFNYVNGNLDDVREMLLAPNSVIGLSDAGAHCGAICDASFPTTALALWTNRTAGEGPLPLELMVHHLTQRTARQVGWFDRGVLAPGHVADVNVIDLDRLGARRPRIVHDLPAGGRRLVQSADGYVRTIKGGTVTFADGEHTGELPGGLVRGAQPAPSQPATS